MATATPAPSWSERGGFRQQPLRPAGTRPGLVRTDPSLTSLAFTNRIPESRHLTNQILLNGSGLAAGDVDGDGWTDVFLAGFDGPNALFRNLGNWRFQDITDASGLALPGMDCTGAAFADLDGDGDLDLVVNTLAQGTLILTNNGRGAFGPSGPPLLPGRGSMTPALADINGDGLLDLYVANYRTRALMDMPNTRMTFRKTGGRTVVDTVNGRAATDPEFAGRFQINAAGGIEENGEPDALFRNLGGGRFEEMPWTSGTFLDANGAPLSEPPRDWGLAAMFRDVNGDGLPDLYVCNDFQSPDRLWLLQADGRFRAAPPLALRRTSLSSMAVDFADINRDGHDDFLVLDMLSRDHAERMRWVRDNFPHQPVIGRFDDQPQLEQNTLQLGRGDGTWAEIAQLSGLEATDWAWACAFVDLDLDGWEDVLVVNGMERAARDLDTADRLRTLRQSRRLTDTEVFQARRAFPRLATPNLAFRNQRDLTFQDASREWGFDLPGISQSIALADLDNDGDLDVLVGNLNDAVAVYRNDAPGPRLAVRLAGLPPNTRGIGARIEVLGGPVPQSQEMIAGGRYLSGDDPVRCFAATRDRPLTVRVRWRSGAVSEARDIPPDSLVEIAEPATTRSAGRTPPIDPPAAPQPRELPDIRFEDVSARLNHRHTENEFDDFTVQPLLPRKLSQPGPGVAWADLDGDGDDDLVVGTGSQGRLGVFRNLGNGQFEAWSAPALVPPLSRDTTGLAVLPSPNRPRLLAALSHVEDGTPLGPAILAWDPAAPSLSELAPTTESSAGPIALADIDGDGDLDLFVGGSAISGRWPARASSRFYRQQDGRFTLDTERSRALAGIGLVTAAVFTDLDNDGDADLALAVEWGPIRVLRQDPSGFVDITRDLGLEEHTGWWTSITAGDFDNDGRLDLVAGNWGRNTPYERHRRSAPRPGGTTDVSGAELRLYHGDFDANGTYDVLEGVQTDPTGSFRPIHPLTTLVGGLPSLRGRFTSHAEFAATDIDKLLGSALKSASIARAIRLESCLLLNRGDRFEVRPLPVEAQMAPAFGLAVTDADGDGNEDLFLAQNFHAVRPHTPRYDAGTGLWLRGDGTGRFTAVRPRDSGIFIPGEQRGAAVADFDADGRPDLVVGQNGGAVRLYRNSGARRGVSVRLLGPASNTVGAGARLRWTGGAHPVREVHLGSGCLSKDSPASTLGRPPGRQELEVIWPGNRRTLHHVPLESVGFEIRAP